MGYLGDIYSADHLLAATFVQPPIWRKIFFNLLVHFCTCSTNFWYFKFLYTFIWIQLLLSMVKKYGKNSIVHARVFQKTSVRLLMGDWWWNCEVDCGLKFLCMVFSSVECFQKVERSPFTEGMKARAFFACYRGQYLHTANLASAQDFFSLNFEAIKNPSVPYLPITERSVFMQWIRNRPSFEVCRVVAQK